MREKTKKTKKTSKTQEVPAASLQAAEDEVGVDVHLPRIWVIL